MNEAAQAEAAAKTKKLNVPISTGQGHGGQYHMWHRIADHRQLIRITKTAEQFEPMETSAKCTPTFGTTCKAMGERTC